MGNIVSRSNLETIGRGIYQHINSIIQTEANALWDEIEVVNESYVDSANYNSEDKLIEFINSSTGNVLATIDATDFIKDGMVSSVSVGDVTIEGEVVRCLIITFNVDAGEDVINIPLTEIFDPSLYYDKVWIDNNLVRNTRRINLGAGLEGAGNLSQDLTISFTQETLDALDLAETSIQPEDIIPITEEIESIWEFIGTDSPNDFNSDFNADFGTGSTILGMIDDLYQRSIELGGELDSLRDDLDNIYTDLSHQISTLSTSKQDKLVFDKVLDSESTNPIENKAIYSQYMDDYDIEDIVEGLKDYSKEYLTIKFIEDGTFAVNSPVYYSKDLGNNWTYLTGSIPVSEGDVVLLKGNLDSNSISNLFDSIVGRYNVYGNPLSLVYGDSFTNYTSVNVGSILQYLFAGSPVVSAKYLSLISPNVPVNGYQGMFQLCGSLVEAPELPATVVNIGGYQSMFLGCTALTKAPVLPATVLTARCYQYMFQNCSALNEITCYATDISASNCLYYCTSRVNSSGTFHKVNNVTYPTGVSGIPSGWNVVDL